MKRGFMDTEDDDEMEIEVEIEGGDSMMNTLNTQRTAEKPIQHQMVSAKSTERELIDFKKEPENVDVEVKQEEPEVEVNVELDLEVEQGDHHSELNSDIMAQIEEPVGSTIQVESELHNNLEEPMVGNENMVVEIEVGGNSGESDAKFQIKKNKSDSENNKGPFFQSTCWYSILTACVFLAVTFLGISSWCWMNHRKQELNNGDLDQNSTWWIGLIFFGALPIVLLFSSLLLCWCTLRAKGESEMEQKRSIEMSSDQN